LYGQRSFLEIFKSYEQTLHRSSVRSHADMIRSIWRCCEIIFCTMIYQNGRQLFAGDSAGEIVLQPPSCCMIMQVKRSSRHGLLESAEIQNHASRTHCLCKQTNNAECSSCVKSLAKQRALFQAALLKSMRKTSCTRYFVYTYPAGYCVHTCVNNALMYTFRYLLFDLD
jgi:hypothetical protein